MSAGSPQVGIVGLGLMGGSLARDLLRSGAHVIAYDRDPALSGGGVDADLSRIGVVTTPAAVMAAPVVVIAVPVEAALDVLSQLAPHVSASHVVMDVGSTKRDIVAHAAALGVGARFVGCHPLAGDHRSGWRASRVALFEGARVAVCPAPGTAHDAVDAACAFWRRVGARVDLESPDAHDVRMAAASHMPHLASAAVALALRHAGHPRASLGPGGRDVTRLAGGSPELWCEIARQNRDHLSAALADVEHQVQRLRELLERGDDPALAAALREAREWFDAS